MGLACALTGLMFVLIGVLAQILIGFIFTIIFSLFKKLDQTLLVSLGLLMLSGVIISLIIYFSVVSCSINKSIISTITSIIFGTMFFALVGFSGVALGILVRYIASLFAGTSTEFAPWIKNPFIFILGLISILVIAFFVFTYKPV